MNALQTAGNFLPSENGLSSDSSRNVLSRIAPVPRADLHRAGEVAAKVVQIITACGLKSGDGLGTKEALRTRFRVSPGTMNEAVRILESRGVIETRRGLKGGLFVSNGCVQLTLKQAIGAMDLSTGEHCRAVSRQLEPLLIEEAARAADAEALEELRALLGEMDRSPEPDRVSFLTHWRLFHRKVAALGSNPLLATIYNVLLEVLERDVESLAPPQLIAQGRQIVEQITLGTQRVFHPSRRRPAEGAS